MSKQFSFPVVADSIHFFSGDMDGYLHPVKTKDEATYFTHALFQYGDYVGDSVTRANVSVIQSLPMYERLNIEERHEGYGSVVLMFPLACLDDTEFQGMLMRLSGYPSLDDMALSEMESDMQADDWDSFGRGDFIRYIENGFELGEIDLDDIPSGEIDELFLSIDREANYSIWSCESGTSGYFDFNGMGGIKEKAETMISDWLDKKENELKGVTT